MLRSIQALERINGQSAADCWEESKHWTEHGPADLPAFMLLFAVPIHLLAPVRLPQLRVDIRQMHSIDHFTTNVERTLLPLLEPGKDFFPGHLLAFHSFLPSQNRRHRGMTCLNSARVILDPRTI